MNLELGSMGRAASPNLDMDGSSNRASKHCFRVRPEILLELEQAISRIPFMGAPMGGVMNDLFIIQLFNGKGRWHAGAVAKDIAAYALHTIHLLASVGQSIRRGSLDAHCGRPVCTWIADKPGFTGLVLPVLRRLSSHSPVVLGAASQMSHRLPPKTAFISWPDLVRVSPLQWYSRYLTVAPKWVVALSQALKLAGLPRRLQPRMQTHLLVEAHRYAAFYKFLVSLKPGVILTEYDRNSFTAPLILAARALGIPTLTMVHGMINIPFGYTPLLADRVFVWGRQGRDRMIEYGVAPERVIVSGHPGLDRSQPVGRAEALARAGIAGDKPVVLLATNPINERPRGELAEVFCKAMAERTDLVAAVRLHPSEALAFYARERSRYPNIHFVENRIWTLNEALAVADVVVCHNTSFGIEALVKRRPVVVLDAISEPLMGARDLIRVAECPAARSSAELSSVVTRLLEEGDYRVSVVTRADSYVAALYDSFGDEAADRIAEAVMDAMRPAVTDGVPS